jgi:hypothetical protein
MAVKSNQYERRIRSEQMLSALPPIATDARTSRIASFVPVPDVSVIM